MRTTSRIISGLLLLLSLSCGSYFNQPIGSTPARTGEVSNWSESLKKLPPPEQPIVVGVYNFKDQTGQYKSVEQGSTFSTAIPQGATTILIKALEDSGWFTPIERENLSHLLNERNIIRSTREEYRRTDDPAQANQPVLPPLLYAGVLLEGGIVSYDTNILTGGTGARYFGVGASTQYRQDRLTIYLRAVSTSTGKILKTVYVSKTILSQALDASLFRYVNFKRLLEVETGFTKNEPIQLALKDAIEIAVESLVLEGIQDGLWNTEKGGKADSLLVNRYQERKWEEENTLLYDRKQLIEQSNHGLAVRGMTTLFDGDFANKEFGGGAAIDYQYSLSPHWKLGLGVNYLYFEGGKGFSKEYGGTDLNLEYRFLPYDVLGPYAYAGLGGIYDLHSEPEDLEESSTSGKWQYGAGLRWRFQPEWQLLLFAEGNQTFSDTIDEVVNGKRDDFYYNFGLGLQFNF